MKTNRYSLQEDPSQQHGRMWTSYATQTKVMLISSQLEANLAKIPPAWPTQDAPYHDIGTGDKPDHKQDDGPNTIQGIRHTEMTGGIVNGSGRGGGGGPLNDLSCLCQLTPEAWSARKQDAHSHDTNMSAIFRNPQKRKENSSESTDHSAPIFDHQIMPDVFSQAPSVRVATGQRI